MTQNYISGGESVALLAFEDPDNWDDDAIAHVASNETFIPFGQGVETSVTRNNNAERVYGVGNRNATATVNTAYGGTLSANGTLTHAWWLLGVLGAVADAGSGPFTHTYTERNVLPSFTTKLAYELGDTDAQSILLGCRINSCTISAAVNEVAKFSLECPYRYETLETTASTNIADTEPVFSFVHGSVEIPNGTVIAAVQSIELTIVNNLENVYEVGSRFARAIVAKQREYNFKVTAAFNSHAKLLTYFFNGTGSATAPGSGSGTEIATMQLTFTNDDGDILEINLTGIHFNEETLPQNQNEVVKEDVTGWARALTNVVYTNDIAIAPKEATNVP